ncbi:ribonuclease H-like domain-containing protein [Paenibacillus alkaliterrae]|uniref:ribonuclease H-like domain-containing protein n=1 Tax=Paenibacillus alkaliterrae TaxID=320909 RepID=UPI001F3C403C|nr:ribonuclease H-like domain-containing protein [Paenibacillus alkaliterrae]MCF2938294.1 ribonuclease H-like domain-containing protein [Paenibacillus alkaliterrae]
MSGLRNRMNRLRGETASNDALIAEAEDHSFVDEESDRLSPVWETFGVKLYSNVEGSFLLRKTVYPVSFRHGHHAIMELRKAASGLSAFHPSFQASAEKVLFLDLETTGLGIGAGNIPFMIGLGYVLDEQFVIEQTLIRHPAEERAMLAYLAEKLQHYNYLATYNGKTFDWPLVQNRFIMNGLGRKIWEPHHLDFLHPARSIWRNTLASCKLSRVEEERLGIHREDDVPGSMAPQLYFQYLADGNPSTLEGVYRHNETDMLSLACLAIRFGHLLNGDIHQYIRLPDEPEEMVRTGLWLEKMGRTELSELLFDSAMRAETAKPSTLLMLAARDKKAGNWMRAVLLWQKAVIHSFSNVGADALEASIELAMYYEHKLKDYESALSHANFAFEHAFNHFKLARLDSKKRAELESLRNRIARLKRKQDKLLL